MANNTVIIENTQIPFSNFAGRPDTYHPAGGKRTFGIILDSKTAQDLRERGCNVRAFRPREDGDEPTPYISVNVRFDIRPPKVFSVSNGKITPLTETTVGNLDYAEIDRVDVVLNLYEYQPGKVSVYLETMYANMKPDPLADKYSGCTIV